jgi:hypothetical protein
MKKKLRFLLILLAFIPLLLGSPQAAESAEQEQIRGEASSFAIAAERFVDNGDGTVTDTMRELMWQKDDNGKEVAFEAAREYCKALRLGAHSDWRLPNPDERENAVAVALRTRVHSPDAYARFDLYWSSDPEVVLPFNYHPSYGADVARTYPAKKDQRAFVRAVRSLVTDKADRGGQPGFPQRLANVAASSRD